MAGDIFFTDSRVWSSSSNWIVDIMTRAISKCRANEDSLVQILSNAEDIRCLGINLQKDRNVRIALTERVLEAAQDKRQELSADPATHPDNIRLAEELVTTAQAHLRELSASPSI